MRQLIMILSFLFILSPAVGFAQKSTATARTHIVTLKNGALFVRLKTSQLQIDALKKMGKEKEAEEIRLNQENINKSVMTAFKENFTFCPVYFFYSTHSTEVKEGNYKGLIFNVNFQTDSSFSSKNYLIGEFDESETTQLKAFIIKDKNYDQLRSPFPYLIKENQALVSTRSHSAVVLLLNKKLHTFYSK